MAAIALFGGAFDPPHIGHVLCAAYALQAAAIDNVWVLPSFEHPYGKQMQPFAQRLAWCRLAFADVRRCEVHDDEASNAGGRTITLLAGLTQRHPEHAFWLIGGTDTEHDLPNWYRGAELASMLAGVVAVPRRGYDDAHPGALPAISSTMIRERIATGETLDGLVPAAVTAAINSSGAYRS